MSEGLLLYGATGFSGKLVAREALRAGLRPILAGRDAAKLARLGAELDLEHRVCALSDAHRLDGILADVRAALLIAGPFSNTSHFFVDACLRTGTHYLDLTGEIPVIERLARLDAPARARGITILPAAGFDAVPSDCLAAHVHRRLPTADRLCLGFTGLQFASRGSSKTLMEHAAEGVRVRRGGAITRVAAWELQREFDFGAGPRLALNVGWGDVSCAYFTTGVPNIEVYFEDIPMLRLMLSASRSIGALLGTATWQVGLKAWMDLLSAGPSDAERAAARMTVVAEMEDAEGRLAISRLHTPEAYTFTAVLAVEIARRVLAGDFEPGFQTAARVYGPDFITRFAGVQRFDIL